MVVWIDHIIDKSKLKVITNDELGRSKESFFHRYYLDWGILFNCSLVFKERNWRNVCQRKKKNLWPICLFTPMFSWAKDVGEEKKQCRTPYQIQFGLPNMHSFHVVEHWVEFARMPKEKKCDETYFFFLSVLTFIVSCRYVYEVSYS